MVIKISRTSASKSNNSSYNRIIKDNISKFSSIRLINNRQFITNRSKQPAFLDKSRPKTCHCQFLSHNSPAEPHSKTSSNLTRPMHIVAQMPIFNRLHPKHTRQSDFLLKVSIIQNYLHLTFKMLSSLDKATGSHYHSKSN